MTDQNDSRKPDGRPTLPAPPTLNADQWDIPLAADTDGVIQLFQELLPTDEFQWILTDNKLLGGTKEQGLDILGIGEQFRMRGWDTTNWEELIKKLEVTVRVHLKILSPEGKRG
ncbi:Ger(x)C family spore germination C-terminal domain-containing protein [Paenibacillus chitinolyticus]|uniref:Ger(X)C family spore germination C-terminal domain-containing protein n=1 Tax=Paenibacillus chitinolyticus TaxID=79263 RepID=A0ABT4F9R6_9BACL|nr:Ger(x)C family spore germination C-terminal domain-containing protein [Paenibacillus chitinolyticus]MCY9591866.1 Ger(x)C family spore germination C-terminal domain-containing protein [Paenibacillus chitinolyticus]MCY9595166.1 Ger(x)C family spore germination C-terminal domain-containing protein [Paenibacillus chitinolyticus]